MLRIWEEFQYEMKEEKPRITLDTDPADCAHSELMFSGFQDNAGMDSLVWMLFTCVNCQTSRIKKVEPYIG